VDSFETELNNRTGKELSSHFSGSFFVMRFWIVYSFETELNIGDVVDMLPLLKRVLLAVLLSKRKIEYLTI
jgi:hypothetical protein